MTTKILTCILGIVYLSAALASDGNRNENLRVIHKLVAGHLTHSNDDTSELVASSAGEGRDKNKKHEEEKKTLSQQVADGKYGLIQRELFSKPLKRPGVLSYKENGEVPKDNAKNLGGLNKNDIWLSENHLLVIKGGTYPQHTDRKNIHASEDTPVWVPIDDYRAPQRQVKIPKNPKVPPPFPVQLTDGGPLLLLGTNATKTLNGTFGSELYPIYSPEQFFPQDEPPSNELPNSHKTNLTSGKTPYPVPPFVKPQLDYVGPPKGVPLNDSFLPLFPFLGPGAVLPPPPENVSDYYDDDDPSIYYPPPYSFYYKMDNTSLVEPGPLVPGIVLPPPPNFFAPLEETKPPTRKPATTTTTPLALTTIKTHITTTLRKINDIFRTTTSPIDYSNNTIPTRSPITRRPYVTTKTTTKKKRPTIAILQPIAPINQDGGRPFKAYGPPPTRPPTVLSTTQVPLKSYYSYQKPNRTYLTINSPARPTAEPPAQFYFYEENVINTTPKFQPNDHLDYYIPKYYVPVDKQTNRFVTPRPQTQNLRYYYLNDDSYKPTKKPDSFGIHIARLKAEIETQQSIPKINYPTNTQLTSKPVYQYSFQSANYQNQNAYVQPEYQNNLRSPPSRYRVEIQEAVEVTAPTPTFENSQQGNYYYQNAVTDNPLGHQRDVVTSKSKPNIQPQYSFEATPNPIYQQYYTKQDEKYIDDVTKEYFTVFGKKLPITTTPIPHVVQNQYNYEYYQKPYNTQNLQKPSLEKDTIINYLRNHPPLNPQAEYIPIQQAEYVPIQQPPKYIPQVQQTYSQSHRETYNYENARRRPETERKPYITYKLPGDEGTHFYFLTPQLAQQKEQNSSFYFSRSRPTDKNRYL